MSSQSILPREFYHRHAVEVARGLLGCRLVRMHAGQRLAGLISETEAYYGEEDLACHARAGLTPRTRIMYGPPGHAYVYFTYGMHWLANTITGAEGFPAAVLLRAIRPLEGLDRMALNRPNLAHTQRWLDGPAKLTQAMGIHGNQNGLDLCNPAGGLWIEAGEPAADNLISAGPRIGLNTVPEPWKSMAWRFLLSEDKQGPQDACG